jgi:hypothetical protein
MKTSGAESGGPGGKAMDFEEEEEVEYTVVLVFPGFGSERDSAETVVETALQWLNANREEPGFRFAPTVSARLEIVADDEAARERIESGDDVAMVIVHDLEDRERDALIRHCKKRHIGACYTVDTPRPKGGRKEPMKLVLGAKSGGGPPAHRICTDTLTDPIGDDEDTGDRAGDLIAVMALGVMEHHWHVRHP